MYTYYRKLILLLFLILSLNNFGINFEREKAEPPHSAFSLLLLKQKDSLPDKYRLAKKLYKDKKYSEALEAAFFVVENSTKLQEKALIYMLIGDIYRDNYNHKRAIEYYNKFLRLKINNKDASTEFIYIDEEQTADLYFKIGGGYQLISKIDSSLYYFNKILQINTLNDKVNLIKANTYNNISAIYRENDSLKNLDLAKNYINKAIEINKTLKENLTLASNYGNLANILMEEGALYDAKSLYLKALKLLDNDNRIEATKYKEVLYDNMGWTLFNLKDYIAYEYLDKSVAIRDSFMNIEITKAIKEIETKNNVELATKDVETKRAIAEKNAIKAKQNTWLVGGIGASATILLLYFLNINKLRKQKLKNELSKNKLIQHQKLEKLKEETQTKILNATIDGKETERKQIAETLHDNVSAMLSSANLHIQATQKQFKGSIPIELQKTQQIIIQASQQIRDLSHNLVSSVLLKFGLHYALKDVAEKYSNSEITFDTQLFKLQRYEQNFEIKVYNVIQELINNIIKHSKADRALIRVREEENKKLYLSIEDNGVGFNAKELLSYEGIGLNQIRARVKMMKGTLSIDSEKNQGTTIKIVLPITERENTFIV